MSVARPGQIARTIALVALLVVVAACARYSGPIKGDNKPHPGVDRARNMPIQGIDIARYQGIIEKLGSAPRPDGPSQGLPPPPLRPKVPFIRAGPLGEGGLTAEVKDGFVVAEAEDLSTAVLFEGGKVPLGRTVRLLLPRGAELELTTATGRTVEVDGPMDLRLR